MDMDVPTGTLGPAAVTEVFTGEAPIREEEGVPGAAWSPEWR
jgi:hypothetical protein